jgi:16S rRNA A1518/A1519 N6-dimethyltransferase RsmA/KsgA/DIM1 with predicted DNA glycosylase/AP lyase activity
MPVHIGAKVGFGSETSNYDAARPEHQHPAVEKLLENLDIPHGGRIVEIGAGTGKFTKHIVNRPENWEVICVEPSDVHCSLISLR